MKTNTIESTSTAARAVNMNLLFMKSSLGCNRVLLAARLARTAGHKSTFSGRIVSFARCSNMDWMVGFLFPIDLSLFFILRLLIICSPEKPENFPELIAGCFQAPADGSQRAIQLFRHLCLAHFEKMTH